MTYRNPSFRVWSDINKFMTAVPRLGSKGSRYIHLPIYRKKKKALSQNSVKLRVLNDFVKSLRTIPPGKLFVQLILFLRIADTCQ